MEARKLADLEQKVLEDENFLQKSVNYGRKMIPIVPIWDLIPKNYKNKIVDSTNYEDLLHKQVDKLYRNNDFEIDSAAAIKLLKRLINEIKDGERLFDGSFKKKPVSIPKSLPQFRKEERARNIKVSKIENEFTKRNLNKFAYDEAVRQKISAKKKAKKEQLKLAYEARKKEIDRVRKTGRRVFDIDESMFHKVQKQKKVHPHKLKRDAKKQQEHDEKQIMINHRQEVLAKHHEKRRAKLMKRNGEKIILNSESADLQLIVDMIETFRRDYHELFLLNFDGTGAWLGGFDVTEARKTIVGLCVFAYQICKARSNLEQAVAVWGLLNASDMVSRANDAFFKMLVDAVWSATRDTADVIYSESLSDSVQGLNSFLSRLAHSSIAEALRNLAIYIASLKFLSREAATTIYSYFGKPKSMSYIEVMEMILNCIATIIRAGESLIAGAPLTEVLFAKDPVVTLIASIRQLLSFSNRLYSGLPQENKMSREHYVTQGKEYIDTGKVMLEKVNPLLKEHSELNLVRNQLIVSVDAVRHELLGENRPMPYGIVLHGDPGIGKGKLLPMIIQLFCKEKGIPYNDHVIFHKMPGSEYWDTYDPFEHPAIHLSEIGNISPTIASVRGDPDVQLYTSLMDTLKLSLNAAFEGKGKTFARPLIVAIDTNNPDLNAPYIMTNEAALFRRSLFIQPMVKPKYRKRDSSSLDSAARLADDESPIMDTWYFHVYSYTAIDKKRCNKIVHLSGGENDDIYALMRFLSESFREHIRIQDLLLTDKNKNVNLDDYLKPIIAESGPLEEKRVENIPPPRLIPRLSLWLIMFLRTCTLLLIAGSVQWCLPKGNRTDLMQKIFIMILLLIIAVLVSNAPIMYFILALFSTIVVLETILRRFIFKYVSIFYIDRYVSSLLSRLHILTSRTTLVSNKPYSWSTKLLAVIGAASGALMIARLCLNIAKSPRRREDRDEDINTYLVESEANPVYDDELSKDIKGIEEMMGAGSSYKRVAIAGHHQIWNVQSEFTPTSVHKGDPLSLFKAIQKNSRNTIVYGTVRTGTYILGLCSNIALINTHAIPKTEQFEIDVMNDGLIHMDNALNSIVKSRIFQEDIVHLGNDISLIRVHACRFRDIRSHLLAKQLSEPKYLGVIGASVTEVQPLMGNFILRNTDTGDFSLDQVLQYDFPNHGPGKCGLPVICRVDNGSVIAGFHSGGLNGSRNGYATIFNKDRIVQGVESLEKNTSLMSITSESRSYCRTLGEPSPKSPFRYEDLRHLTYYGRTDSKVMINQNSKLEPTPFATEVECIFRQHGMLKTQSFGKPMMKPGYVNGEYISPYNVSLRDISTEKFPLDKRVLEKCVSEYTRRIVDMLKDRNVPDLAPLTMIDAINGAADDAFIQRINVSTSAGYNFPGKKNQYLEFDEDNSTQDRIINAPKDLLKREVLQIMKLYSHGKSAYPVYKAQLKDEPRELSKIPTGKTRLFYMSPVDHLIVSRMLLAPIYSLMIEYNDIFCCAIGINMFSSANDIYLALSTFSPNIMEGDYKAFDKKRVPDIAHGACTVIYNIAVEMGYNDLSLKMLRSLLSDHLTVYVELLGDLFSCNIQPSGSYGTAEYNCVVNVLMLMYAWYKVGNVEKFFDNNRPCTYGDDVLNAVKEEFQYQFNNVVYAKACKEFYNIEYTSADKSSELDLYVTIDSASFLKRKFIWRDDIGERTAILDHNSLIKTLSWRMPSKHVTEEEQMFQCLSAVLWELAIRLPNEEYEDISSQLKTIFYKHYPLYKGVMFKTYYYILNRIFPNNEYILGRFIREPDGGVLYNKDTNSAC